MRVFVTGVKGQLGYDVMNELEKQGLEGIGVDIDEMDITDADQVNKVIKEAAPDAVIHCAAYTAVDAAEDNVELCRKVNAEGTRNIAKVCKALDIKMMYISTDYVFDGAGSHYRREDEATGPLNVYGETKRAGELALEQGNPRHLIFRTSWVYATRGANFAKTMLRLAGEKETLSIIDDQHGAPTGAELLADCTATAIRETLRNPALAGTYHLVASGETSWCDYARYVFEVARAHGAELAVQEVKGIPTTAYPTPAKRPLNSRLSNEKFQQAFGVTLPDWRQGVARVVTEVLGK